MSLSDVDVFISGIDNGVYKNITDNLFSCTAAYQIYRNYYLKLAEEGYIVLKEIDHQKRNGRHSFTNFNFSLTAMSQGILDFRRL